ncbi:hypothetical protein CAQU_08865 [Corynebacterium aquilae DSM 44791]|uniref:Uncharacterized protein n=1 Tax=Corynebacterium aquilae DSM 44791 TaxID=1431546 RepID=A0A1L7CH55_9CORY|nr:hypothetical protein CAQU_08865 [Corynebacterium aquilae DSM 44791]
MREGPQLARVVYVSLHGKDRVNDCHVQKALAQFAMDFEGLFDWVIVGGSDGQIYYSDGGGVG